jgi:hypothetical protein
MTWNDKFRTLEFKLAEGSRLLSPQPLTFNVQLLRQSKSVIFAGKTVSVSFR